MTLLKHSQSQSKTIGNRKTAHPATWLLELPAETFHMGSDRHYPEEAPVHRVAVDSF